MNAEQLSKVGSDLVRRCGTRDPFQIANALGINVMDDCENLGSLKGMYCIVKRNRFIFLNKDLSPQMKRIVCAHEIGHDRLHRALAKKHGLQEFVLYDMATKPEYEANIVAAEILLDSDEILEYIYDYPTSPSSQAAAPHGCLASLLIARSGWRSWRQKTSRFEKRGKIRSTDYSVVKEPRRRLLFAPSLYNGLFFADWGGLLKKYF